MKLCTLNVCHINTSVCPQGFCVLIQREWLEFGHKFADRCGNGACSADSNERCPVFLQWLDCVHQLLKQFPSAFQLNEAVLVSGCESLDSLQ